MGKVVHEVSMSLDGFITGPNVRPEAGLGDGGERLHEWAFDEADPHTSAIVESFANFGATIVGRTTYDLSIRYWGANGPLGATRLPTIIVSHNVPSDVPEGGVYSFVNGVEAAFAKAKALAGAKDISSSGSDVASQALALGLIDEIAIHVVPVLLGSGTPLFGKVDLKHVKLEPLETIQAKDVIHLRFSVIRQ